MKTELEEYKRREKKRGIAIKCLFGLVFVVVILGEVLNIAMEAILLIGFGLAVGIACIFAAGFAEAIAGVIDGVVIPKIKNIEKTTIRESNRKD